ncbi:hypothetical protein BDV19DRAFT_394847 [Aspergillus venezuelensis]
MTTTPPPTNCTLCKKPASPTCMIRGRTKFPHLHARRSDPGLNLRSSLALPIPECPICKKSIRVSCLTERHIIPCRSCGLSYASTPLISPENTNNVKGGAFDWAHEEAMTWLATLRDRPRAESPRPETAKIAKAELKKVINAQLPKAHSCIDSFTTTQDICGNTVIMGLHGFEEWDRRLDILSVSSRENHEGEVASASKALHALKEVCEIIQMTLEYIKTQTTIPSTKWSMDTATIRSQALTHPDCPWNRWHCRPSSKVFEGSSIDLGPEIELQFLGKDEDAEKMLALGENVFTSVEPFVWKGIGRDPFAGREAV